MSNPFVTNDPLVRSYKFLVPGVKPRVEFKGGILDPDDYGPDAETVRTFLMERTHYPIHGSHYHLKHGTTPVREEDSGPVPHLGPTSTRNLRGMRR